MRTDDWFHAAAAALALMTAAPLSADIIPPERPTRLAAETAHSLALVPGLAMVLILLAIAALGIVLYRRQGK